MDRLPLLSLWFFRQAVYWVLQSSELYLLEWLLSAPEYDRLRARIDELANLEETSRALSRTVSEMQLVLATAIMHP